MPSRRKAAGLLLATLTLSSTWYVFKHVIQPHVVARRTFVDQVLGGTAEAPYQYRVLHPLLGHGLESALPSAFGDEWRHCAAYGLVMLVCFAGIYGFFHAWLRMLFTPATALLGSVMLALPLPLAVTGHIVEGDFVTLLVFSLGFWLMATGREVWLPLLVGLGTLNREQTAYLIVFFAASLAARRSLGGRREQALLAASVMAFLAVFLGVRAFYGPRPNPYGVAFNVAHNMSPRNLREAIAPLWLAEVVGPAVLAGMAFRRTTTFLRLGFLALGPYLVLFVLNGLLIEMAKFLPAFLVLIPMALQTLTGERPRDPPEG